MKHWVSSNAQRCRTFIVWSSCLVVLFSSFCLFSDCDVWLLSFYRGSGGGSGGFWSWGSSVWAAVFLPHSHLSGSRWGAGRGSHRPGWRSDTLAVFVSSTLQETDKHKKKLTPTSCPIQIQTYSLNTILWFKTWRGLSVLTGAAFLAFTVVVPSHMITLSQSTLCITGSHHWDTTALVRYTLKKQ